MADSNNAQNTVQHQASSHDAAVKADVQAAFRAADGANRQGAEALRQGGRASGEALCKSLFLGGVTPLEYQAHRHFAYLSRHFNGPGPRFAALCQSVDEMRHAQTEIHTLSNYNKYYGGMHSFANSLHTRRF